MARFPFHRRRWIILVTLGVVTVGYLLTFPMGFPGSLLLLLLVALPVPLTWLGLWITERPIRRRHYRLTHHLCVKCGYDLRGHVAGQAGPNCPECGTPMKS